MTKVMPCSSLASCSPPSRPLRAASGGGLRPALTAVARDASSDGVRHREKHQRPRRSNLHNLTDTTGNAVAYRQDAIPAQIAEQRVPLGRFCRVDRQKIPGKMCRRLAVAGWHARCVARCVVVRHRGPICLPAVSQRPFRARHIEYNCRYNRRSIRRQRWLRALPRAAGRARSVLTAHPPALWAARCSHCRSRCWRP
jgi:hypothetical protein